MLRFMTAILWVFVTLAFGFDVVAEPCNLRIQVGTAQTATSDMPCHEGMMMSSEVEMPDAPEHQSESCCCAALLTNAFMFERVRLERPAPGISTWATPLPETANSISIEYEPPPPRA